MLSGSKNGSAMKQNLMRWQSAYAVLMKECELLKEVSFVIQFLVLSVNDAALLELIRAKEIIIRRREWIKQKLRKGSVSDAEYQQIIKDSLLPPRQILTILKNADDIWDMTQQFNNLCIQYNELDMCIAEPVDTSYFDALIKDTDQMQLE